MALRPLNVLSFCAGVGGLELGIRIAEPGARGVAYVEREAAAAASLVASMEAGWFHPAPIWSDAGTFDARPWRGVVHCVASGDPCQPNSVAGRGLGAADDRWLIDQLLRIVEECGPDRVFRENVTGNIDGQLAALVPALEAMGYRVAIGIFSAAEAGASHRRERLFIMADREDVAGRLHAGSWGCGKGAAQSGGCGDRMGHADGQREVAFAEARSSRRPARQSSRNMVDAERARWAKAGCGRSLDAGPQPFAGGCPLDDAQRPERWPIGEPCRDARRDGLSRGKEGPDRAGASGASMADASRAGPQGRELDRACDDERHGPDAHGSASELRGAWLPPFAPGPADPRWPAIIERAPGLEPAVRRMADGLAYRTERLRACGNGVVPLAAANAWLSLDAALRAGRGAGAAVVRIAA